MQDSLFFEIDACHFARQLKLDVARAALAALGGRCVDYLRLALAPGIDPQDAPRLFPGMLQPSRVPVDRSVILGIHARLQAKSGPVPRLVGVLYFLHPLPRNDTWFVTLLLLEPTARGQGLGRAVHRAFERWAAARGAARFVVAVADNNLQAWRFWRDRLGYQEIEPVAWSQTGALKHRELEYRLNVQRVSAPTWRGRES